MEENIVYGISMKMVRGYTINLTKLIPYGEVGADRKHHQIQMIYTQHLDAEGFLPD